jgi:hypothetical protein
VDSGLVRVVELRTRKAEVGSGTMNEPEHIPVEGNRGVQVFGPDIYMMDVHATSDQQKLESRSEVLSQSHTFDLDIEFHWP